MGSAIARALPRLYNDLPLNPPTIFRTGSIGADDRSDPVCSWQAAQKGRRAAVVAALTSGFAGTDPSGAAAARSLMVMPRSARPIRHPPFGFPPCRIQAGGGALGLAIGRADHHRLRNGCPASLIIHHPGKNVVGASVTPWVADELRWGSPSALPIAGPARDGCDSAKHPLVVDPIAELGACETSA